MLVLFAFVLAAPARPAEPPAPIKEVVSRFTQPDWEGIQRAERELESRQKEAIPELIALLDRHEVVELTGDDGLGYPGGVFFGHGEILPYDLDYLPARAGWALEELTFEDFGFQGSAKKKPVSIQVYPVPEGGIPKPEPPTRQERDEKFDPAIANAKKWWRENGAGWSRLKALEDALGGADSHRQYRALTWLRSGTTRCDGLTLEVYAQEVKPLVDKLAGSPSPQVEDQAKLLLAEGWRPRTER
jgi:hypothetical protein